MSLDTVVEDIHEQARQEAEEIREQARREAEEIREQARQEAEEIVAEREREVERRIEQERERELSSAQLEAKQERLEARRDVLEEVRERVEDAVAELEADREELTRTLLEAASEEFEEGPVLVYGRADDRELVESILVDYEGYAWDGERDVLGGVIVESEASRVRVNNTFDSILDDVWEDSLRDVSEMLFEDAESGREPEQ